MKNETATIILSLDRYKELRDAEKELKALKPHKRESGYYHVLKGGEWNISYYDSFHDYWDTNDVLFKKDDFWDKIDERKLVRNPKNETQPSSTFGQLWDKMCDLEKEMDELKRIISES